MLGVLEALAEDLRIQGRLNVGEAFIDGSFAPPKRRIEGWQNQTWQRERRSWLWQRVNRFSRSLLRLLAMISVSPS